MGQYQNIIDPGVADPSTPWFSFIYSPKGDIKIAYKTDIQDNSSGSVLFAKKKQKTTTSCILKFPSRSTQGKKIYVQVNFVISKYYVFIG